MTKGSTCFTANMALTNVTDQTQPRYYTDYLSANLMFFTFVDFVIKSCDINDPIDNISPPNIFL
ncbi:MAG: hypothetical protein ACI9XK_004770, partial [Granulosicoccus sp.]